MANLYDINSALPKRIKQPIKYIYGLVPTHMRHGKAFCQNYQFIQKSQWWSREKLEEYQMQQLNKLLNHAYDNIPYYKKVFDERDLKPNDIKSIPDFKKLPLLTKILFNSCFSEAVEKTYTKVGVKLSDWWSRHKKYPTGMKIHKEVSLGSDETGHRREVLNARSI